MAAGLTVCAIAVYEQLPVDAAHDVLPAGLALTPAWLRSVLRRAAWADAIAVGPALSLDEAHVAAAVMLALANGGQVEQQLASALPAGVVEDVVRAAQQFRAELQVRELS